jgi:hypothetical protein
VRLRHSHRQAIVGAVVLFAASLCTAPPAAAQETPQPTGPFQMSMQEWRGLSCLWGGVFGGGAVFYYSDVLAVAAIGTTTSPILLVPLVATGVLSGCSFAADVSVGLIWLWRQL